MLKIIIKLKGVSSFSRNNMEKISFDEVKNVWLEILEKITEICKNNQLEYSLAYGTLIGAVRHKGFIPWDDDVDIFMERKYYDKLIDYFIDNEKELRPLKLYHYSTVKDYPFLIARIGDTRYPIKQLHEKEYEMSVFIDIYPIDYAKKNYDMTKIKTINWASVLVNKNENANLIKKIKSSIISIPVRLFYKAYYKKIEDMLRSEVDRDFELEGVLAWLDGPLDEVLFPSSWYKETIYTPFENHNLKIYKNYDGMLRAVYGDYMRLPDEANRIKHHFYDAYKN